MNKKLRSINFIAMGLAKKRLALTEEEIEVFFPENIRSRSNRFFTPLDVALKAAAWLRGDDGRDVIDIGAGAGKFCLCGAYHFPDTKFYGIEARPQLADTAARLFTHFNTANAKVIHSNILHEKFSHFKAIYMFNPYQENLVPFMSLDSSMDLSTGLYRKYVEHTRGQLNEADAGTRLATYHMNNYDVPLNYDQVDESERGRLKFWVKTK